MAPRSMPQPKRQAVYGRRLFDDPGADVPMVRAVGGSGWGPDTWRARELTFVETFEVEVERTRMCWRKAAAALHEGAAAMEDHLVKAESYGASANTIRRMREEHERDLAENRFDMWDAERIGTWLVQCRFVIWLGAMVRLTYEQMREAA